MFLPIGDTPNPERFTAWVNWALIAVNVAIYLFISLPLGLERPDPADPTLAEYLRMLAPRIGDVPQATVLEQISRYDLFVFDHGFKPGAASIADLFSSMFLHGGFAHLAGNMLFLWIFGDNAEHQLGRGLYLVIYLVTGVLATLSFSLLSLGSMVPLVGASGAISGVLGVYFLLFPRNKVKIFVALFPFFLDVVLLPVRWVLGFYVIAQNLLPMLLGAQSGVAYGAHLGGFFAGLGIAVLGERWGWRSPLADREWKQQATGRGTIEGVRSAVMAGDAEGAIRELAGMSGHELAGVAPSHCARLARWLDDRGHTAAALRLLRQVIAHGARWPKAELARAHLELARLRFRLGHAAAAYQHLLQTLELDPDPETELAARDALAKIDVYRGRS